MPNWPLLRLRHPPDARDSPRATVETVRTVRRLAAVCPLAAAAGLAPEQTLAEARAICPGLIVLDAAPAADRAALASLAAWAERYTPLAAPDPPDGLILDITGCEHLFGGEVALAADLAARLERFALPHRLAIAGTPAAAWALARAVAPSGPVTRIRPGTEAAALAALPIALLRLDARMVAGLRRLGLRSIGELARQSRSGLAARFGPLPTLRLDHAFGRAEEPIAWPRLPQPWEARRAFAEPIGTPDDLARTLDQLTTDLCDRLAAGERGATSLVATFIRLDGAHPAIAVATALPSHDPQRLARLLREKLPAIDPGFGIDAAILAAETTAPLRPPQSSLGPLSLETTPPLAATIDTLANRLGPAALWRPAPCDSHIPERAATRLPPLAKAPAWELDPSAERPIRLFHRPEPIEATALVPDEPPIQFRWRGALHRVRAATGPERIAAEWWRRTPDDSQPETNRIRDYYRVEDSAGARFWLFRIGLDGTPRWFLHGLFG